MNRLEAQLLLKTHLKNKNLLKHSYAAEGAMRVLAQHFNEDPDLWGIAGLLHDIDLDIVGNNMDLHAEKGALILEEAGIHPEIVHAVRAHNAKVPRVTKMDYCLYSADPATGLIVASVLMHPTKKIAQTDIKFIMKRFKEKRFAAGANRAHINDCSLLEMETVDFMAMVLKGMQSNAKELGL